MVNNAEIHSLQEERARKEIELAQQRNDKNVQDLIKKLEETRIDRQHVEEEIKRQRDNQAQESRKATEELESEYKKMLAIKENEILRLRSQLEENNARPKFSLGNSFLDWLFGLKQ